MTRTVFSGLDSAWGGRAPGALATLVCEDGGTLRVLSGPRRLNWDDVISEILKAPHENHVLAIDQGLVVPNAKGMRPVEAAIARALRDFGRCAAYPSNTSNASCYGPTARIWDLVEGLEAQGYHQDPSAVAARTPGRFYFECYPHPALLGVFALPRILRYKVQHKDREAWRKLVELLRSLKGGSPAIVDIENHVPLDMLQTKANEDMLDALVAAYVGAYLWFHGTERSSILGDLTTGYMVTPHSDPTLGAFKTAFGPDLNRTGRAISMRPSGAGTVVAPMPTPTPAITDEKTVTLKVSDTGNLWGSLNPWIPSFDRELLVQLEGGSEEQIVRFAPFSKGGATQKGLKVGPEAANRARWKTISAGAATKNVLSYRATWRQL